MKPVHAIAVLLLVCACKPEIEAGEPESSTVAPPASAPDVVFPALTAEGWGPIKMEMTHEQAMAALGGKAKPDDTERDEDWLACHAIRPQTPEGVWIQVEEDRVSVVSLEPDAKGVFSDKGISPGDPEAKVRAAYPTGLKEEKHHYEDPPAKYLTWWAKPGVAGIRYTIGHDGKVNSIAGGTGSIELAEGCS
jgi:hypothetical protein